MWEVKAQWWKAEACAMKERGNVQAEAEGTCSMPYYEALAGWLEAQAHVRAFVQGNVGMWGMQGQPFWLGRCEHSHLPLGRVHPAESAYCLSPLLNKDLHSCVSSHSWHRCSDHLSHAPWLSCS